MLLLIGSSLCPLARTRVERLVAGEEDTQAPQVTLAQRHLDDALCVHHFALVKVVSKLRPDTRLNYEDRFEDNGRMRVIVDGDVTQPLVTVVAKRTTSR